MSSSLLDCARNFGPPPRRFPFWSRVGYLHVPKPWWLWVFRSDELSVLFEHLDDVSRNGIVTWGHVIQANEAIFEPGLSNCPGELVYSLSEPARVDARALAQIAEELYTLKGTTPRDPELAQIAAHLTDELTRVFGRRVPTSIDPKGDCRISTSYFVRKHLPRRRLCAPLLPIIVQATPPHVAIPLPGRYWPADLVEAWSACDPLEDL